MTPWGIRMIACDAGIGYGASVSAEFRGEMGKYAE